MGVKMFSYSGIFQPQIIYIEWRPPVNVPIVFYVWVMAAAAVFVLAIYYTVEERIMIKKFYYAQMAAVFVVFTAVLLQIYPELDRFIYNNARELYMIAAAPGGQFGAIHTPTLLLGFLVAIGSILAKPAALWLQRRANIAAATGAAAAAAGRDDAGD